MPKRSIGKSTIMKSKVAFKLKKLRVESGLSQQEIADYLKIDRTTYTKYETGVSEINYYILEQLAILFNVSYDYILCYDLIKKTERSDKIAE